MRRVRPLHARLAGLLALLAGGAAATGALTPGPLDALTVPHLDWRPCGEGSEFVCARAQVPLDYREPGRRTIELALIKRAAADPALRIGTLFFNPGGPGGAGTRALPLWYAFFPRELQDHFDIVSWDPRGVGESTAVGLRAVRDLARQGSQSVRRPVEPPHGQLHPRDQPHLRSRHVSSRRGGHGPRTG
jgi:pimeloyl-ACP methyl ester carboxylesterase